MDLSNTYIEVLIQMLSDEQQITINRMELIPQNCKKKTKISKENKLYSCY